MWLRALRHTWCLPLAVVALPSGAAAAGLVAAGDLFTRAPTGETVITPSLLPIIAPATGLTDVGIEGETMFGGSASAPGAAGHPLSLSGGPMDSTPVSFLGADGAITAVWSQENPSQSAAFVDFARLAPGASTWTLGTPVAGQTGDQGAVKLADGTLEMISYDRNATPLTLTTRTLAPGASSWSAATTVTTLPSGVTFDEENHPTLVTSPDGTVVAGAWSEYNPGTNDDGYDQIGFALQATDGTWPAAAQHLLGSATNQLDFEALAVAPSGRNARILMTQYETTAPYQRGVVDEMTDSGEIPDNGVPPAPAGDGDGSFVPQAATFDPDGTLRIIGDTPVGIAESDVPTANHAQDPGAPYNVVTNVPGEYPLIALARLPDNTLLMSYTGQASTSTSNPIDLITRPLGGSWSAPQQLLAGADHTFASIGGIATDAGGRCLHHLGHDLPEQDGAVRRDPRQHPADHRLPHPAPGNGGSVGTVRCQCP